MNDTKLSRVHLLTIPKLFWKSEMEILKQTSCIISSMDVLIGCTQRHRQTDRQTLFKQLWQCDREGVVSGTIYLDQTLGIVHWTEELWDVWAGVVLWLWLGGWVLMEADSLGWKPALVQLLVLTGHRHHLLCFRLHGRENLITNRQVLSNYTSLYVSLIATISINK